MLLRKRPRTTMKRNTTLSQVMPFDLNFAPDAPQNNGPHHNNHNPHAQPPSDLTHRYFAGFNRTDQIFSTTNHQMPHKLDFFELPEFLRFCYRCQRRLTTDSDIYMYRYVHTYIHAYIHIYLLLYKYIYFCNFPSNLIGYVKYFIFNVLDSLWIRYIRMFYGFRYFCLISCGNWLVGIDFGGYNMKLWVVDWDLRVVNVILQGWLCFL